MLRAVRLAFRMQRFELRFLLAWRLQRWEIAAIAVAAIGLTVLALLKAFRYDELVAGCRAAIQVVAPCGGLREAGTIYDIQDQTTVYLVRQGLAVLPFIAGVILGVPLLARELEHGTAQLAWPLAASRARWLAIRLVPIAVIGIILMLPAALAGEVLLRSQFPVISPGANFEGYGERGLLTLLRFELVFVAGALIGGWLGHQLPGVLVAGLAAAGIGAALTFVQPYWVEPVAQQIEVFQPIDSLGDKYVGVRYRVGGQWIRDEEAYALMRWDGLGDEPDPSQIGPEQVTYLIRGERYPEVVARESAALLGAGVCLCGVLLLLVRRRRPG
jgi:hypothetical protein